MTEAKLDWQELIEKALTVEGSIGDTYSRFYRYSFLNCVLLMMQGVETPVATYDGWKKLGRQVLKGTKAKTIIRPITIMKKNEAGEVEASFKRFKAVKCIFALTDTEGPDLPPVEHPAWDKDLALTKLDIKQVPFRALDGNLQGYSVGREIAINPLATDHLATLTHEIAHVVLRHTEPEALATYRAHRGLMEFQAEATSYLTLNELGELTDDRASESRAYIQGWIRKERPSDPSIRQVFVATDSILKAGRA